MPSEGLAFADHLLHRLLNRVELRPERKQRVIERLPARSWLSEDRDDLHARLLAAEAEAAINLEWGHGANRHNIDAVVLKDPDRLYRFLDRIPLALRVETVAAALQDRLAGQPQQLTVVLDRLVENWRVGRNLVRDLGSNDPDTAVKVFKSAAVLLLRSMEGMDLRTFSRRATGDSKFLERNKAKIVDVLRQAEVVPDYLDADEVLAVHGILKYPQPCLLAGALTYRGTKLPAEPFLGIAPEMVDGVGVASQPSWILTIENLASFNRQVREAADRGVVVYTGGFPSDAVLRFILKVAETADCPIFHWGDIDGGGIKIAYWLETALARVGRRLALHLMSPEIARSRGVKCEPAAPFRHIPANSIIMPLAEFLAGPDAHHLEQEELDPVSPLPKAQ
ncbi:DUF2399 domain-containing protein [Inquilinus limosus]|uniref:Wadjet anti-phage system protein JetD domain-containing protein n=1 Tax=Inquilinus limosus TaxID=171674 RepID=UPI003F141FCB